MIYECYQTIFTCVCNMLIMLIFFSLSVSVFFFVDFAQSLAHHFDGRLVEKQINDIKWKITTQQTTASNET